MATVARRIQAVQLPEELCHTLEPFNRACLDCQAVEPPKIIASLRPMLARDLEGHPERRAWLRRQGAQLLLTALQRSGLSGKRALSTLARLGPELVPSLGLRYLETRRTLPRILRSDPSF